MPVEIIAIGSFAYYLLVKIVVKEVRDVDVLIAQLLFWLAIILALVTG